MVPTIFLYTAAGGDDPQYEDLVTWMRKSVRKLTQSGITYGKQFAPGEKLKNDIAGVVQDIGGGAVGLVYMPWQFIFTLPPGTKPHLIPKGGSKEQLQKGYPLRFFWQKVGRVVSFWSVSHPGYKGDPWDLLVYDRVDRDMKEEIEQMGEHIAARWAGA